MFNLFSGEHVHAIHNGPQGLTREVFRCAFLTTNFLFITPGETYWLRVETKLTSKIKRRKHMFIH